MIPMQRSSYEMNFYNKPAFKNYRDTNMEFKQPKNRKSSLVQELYRSQFSEQDFYDRVKTGLETTSDVNYINKLF